MHVESKWLPRNPMDRSMMSTPEEVMVSLDSALSCSRVKWLQTVLGSHSFKEMVINQKERRGKGWRNIGKLVPCSFYEGNTRP